MAFIETPNTAKVAVHYTLFDQQIINTLWFELQGENVWSGASLNTLCEDVWEWAGSYLLAILSSDIALTLVDAVDQSAPASFYGSYSNTAVNGEIASQSMPTGTCLTIKFASDLTGRNYRGRNYVSGLPTNGVTDNQVFASFAADLEAAYTALPTVLTVPDCFHVIASHYFNNAPRAAGVTVNVQDYIVVDRNLDSQRRRLTGRGS